MPDLKLKYVETSRRRVIAFMGISVNLLMEKMRCGMLDNTVNIKPKDARNIGSQATVPMVQDVTFFTMRRRTRSSPSMEATPPPGPETVAAVEVVER